MAHLLREHLQSGAPQAVCHAPAHAEEILAQSAGELFDTALTEAGIDRKLTYVTNAVKHFKFEPRGKRRIHKKPSELEVAACGQWLRRELQLIEPKIVVALGATAARALFGRAVAVGENRGKILSGHAPGAPDVLVTVHPSYLLRVPPEQHDAEYAQFVADLRLLSPTTPAHASADDRR